PFRFGLNFSLERPTTGAMKIVRPGAAASRPIPMSSDAARRLRLGRAAGALLGAGWLFTLALTVVAGPLPDTSGTMLALAGAATLGAIALLVAELAPARGPEAVSHALVMAPALLAAVSLTAGGRALARARAARAARPAKGDPALVHRALATRARLDPDRFAALAMDIDLQEGRGLTVAEGNRL